MRFLISLTSESNQPSYLIKYHEKFNRDNFHEHSAAVWIEDKVTRAELGEPDFVSDSGSTYWMNDFGVYRESNHWGMFIGMCLWLLGDGWSGESQRKTIAYCAYKDFRPNDSAYPVLPNQEMCPRYVKKQRSRN